MNKTVLSILGVVVIIAAVAIFITKGKPQSASQNTNQPGQTQNTNTSGKKMAFSDFAKQGGSYKCTVTQYIDQGMTQSTEGTVYLDGGKIRGEYSTKVQGMSIDTSVIVRDGFAYTWTSMSPTGYKIAVKDQAGDTNASANGSYSWNDKMIGDYNCESWSADQSKFAVPTSVTFQEIQQ